MVSGDSILAESTIMGGPHGPWRPAADLGAPDPAVPPEATPTVPHYGSLFVVSMIKREPQP